jgi:dihydroorotate dehydrogenase (NAD+) catalytic subunit
MQRALREFTGFGGNPEQAFASVETPTRCGVGLCGECSCGGHLTCRQGTFLSAAFLERNGIDIEEITAEKAERYYSVPEAAAR